jgi:hypothetical protein
MASWHERRERVWTTLADAVDRGVTDAPELLDAVRRHHGQRAVLDLLRELEERTQTIPAELRTPQHRR